MLVITTGRIAPFMPARVGNHSVGFGPSYQLTDLTIIIIRCALHMAGAQEILIDQSGFSRREKLYCLHRKGIEIRYLFSLKTVLAFHEKGFTIPGAR